MVVAVDAMEPVEALRSLIVKEGIRGSSAVVWEGSIGVGSAVLVGGVGGDATRVEVVSATNRLSAKVFRSCMRV